MTAADTWLYLTSDLGHAELSVYVTSDPTKADMRVYVTLDAHRADRWHFVHRPRSWPTQPFML